ncbi:MAG: FtsW/RodA/SpoVE family cell cycle protein [Mogibacterium sp.]|nr:FtsW/RodA/SpoVE family cell cycle protein [Mogibacterium sp.]MBR3377344.1 FtsW/RodA/SpoVE family cell cycle protein [Mogibacterium sp.]
MRKGDAEVKNKKSMAEKAATRRAIRRERRGQNKMSVTNVVDETKSFGRGLGRVVSGYDFGVVVFVLVLSLFGIAMVFSAGYYQTINTANPDPTYYLVRQAVWVVSGLFIMLVVANIDYHVYMKISNLIMVISLGLLVAVILTSSTVGGAQRGLFGLNITPSEFSKVAIIVFTSCFLVKDPSAIRSAKGLGVLLIVMGLHFYLIVRQPNLSTAIVLVAIMISIMLVAGLNILFMALPAAGAVAGYFYIITAKVPEHWYNRINSFMDPFADRQGSGYQVTQGLIALGNGGLKGLGFGRSVAKTLYLPDPQNDFILAVIGEELGYIGFVLLMLVYIILICRLFMVALKARDKLGFYLATGVAVMLGLQVIINVAVVTSSMPATGITLPFISYGGTSMWSFMIAIGIALNVSRKQRTAKK